MSKFVANWTKSCDNFQRNKSSNQNLLVCYNRCLYLNNALIVLEWDFMTQLPGTKAGNDQSLVVVDRLTKMVKLALCTTTIDSVRSARLFIDTWWKSFGMPKHIVYDRDTRFTSKLFN